MSYSTPRVVEIDSAAHFPKVPRSNRQVSYFVLGGAVLAALVAGSGLRLLRYSSTPGQSYREGAEQTITASGFAHPFHTTAPTLRLASPGLLPSTPSRARLQTVVAGRSDPFASVLTPGQVGGMPRVAVTPTTPSLVIPALPQPGVVTPVPANFDTLRSGPWGLPGRPNSSRLTAPLVGATPEASNRPNTQPPSALDQIAVTGVVQVGDQISVIITEPASPGGRRVTVGETLAAGQVRLQRVDLSASEPLVVLRHRGNDYYRTIGQGATL